MIDRHGLIVNVRPEFRDEYLRLHAAVWPEVEATLTACNITNYSIFIAGDRLVAYYEYVGKDHEADLRKIEADPVSQNWWTHTDPCQVPVAGAPDGTLWLEAALVWHLD
ncbi:MAG TPA: L-rhamnose mutarotase [Galbitalea sp.]|jgi:L-rhamnose mutarotase|nr:L-rhamnose mutarotase [Galbitalea sp.]